MTQFEERLSGWLKDAEILGEVYQKAAEQQEVDRMQAAAIASQLHVIRLIDSLALPGASANAKWIFEGVMTALEGASQGKVHPLLKSSKKNTGKAKYDPIRLANMALAVALVKWLAPGLSDAKIEGKNLAAEMVVKALQKAGMRGRKGGLLPIDSLINWVEEGSLDSQARELMSSLPPVHLFLAVSPGLRAAKLNEIACEMIESERAAKGYPRKPY